MDVEFYKQNAKNRNTTHATNSWYRKYCNWAEGTGNFFLLVVTYVDCYLHDLIFTY